MCIDIVRCRCESHNKLASMQLADIALSSDSPTAGGIAWPCHAALGLDREDNQTGYGMILSVLLCVCLCVFISVNLGHKSTVTSVKSISSVWQKVRVHVHLAMHFAMQK